VQTSAPLAVVSPTEPPSSWSTQRTVALTVGGAGVVGLVIGGIFGAQAISKNSDSKAYCMQASPDLCYPQGLSLRSDAQSAATVSTAAFVAGGALAAGGIVLWLTAPSSKATGTGQVEILPGALGADVGLALRGRW